MQEKIHTIYTGVIINITLPGETVDFNISIFNKQIMIFLHRKRKNNSSIKVFVTNRAKYKIFIFLQ